MPFTLEIFIEGVVAIVPNEPLFVEPRLGTFDYNTPKRVTFLLPDLTKPALASWDRKQLSPHSSIRPSHVPALVVPRLFIRSANEGTRSNGLCRKEAVEHEIFVLQHETIRLDEASHNRSQSQNLSVLSFASNIPDNPHLRQIPEEDERRSLWWVPRMAEISPAHSFLPCGLEEDLKRSRLAAMLSLDRGRLEVASLSTEGYGDRPAIWNFSSVLRSEDGNIRTGKEKRWSRAVATRLVHRIEVEGDAIDFVLSSSEGTRLLTLSPVPLADAVVHVELVNIEPEALLLDNAERFSAGPPDADFEIFYSLTEKNLPPGPLVPVNRSDPDTTKEKTCSPCLYNGSCPRESYQ